MLNYQRARLRQKQKIKATAEHACFTLLATIIFLLFLTTTCYAAEVAPSSFRLILQQGTEVQIYDQAYTATDMPLIPLRLLATEAAIPCQFQPLAPPYAGLVIYGRADLALLILPNSSWVFFIVGDSIYPYQHSEKSYLYEDAVYVPISLLPLMGISYELDAGWQTVRLTLPAPQVKKVDTARLLTVLRDYLYAQDYN